MPFVGRSLLDPFPQQRRVAFRQAWLLRFGRRHHFVGIVGEDALDQFAGVRLARRDGGVAAQIGQRTLAGVEAQLGLAILVVRAVADEAVVGKDGADVIIEANARGQGVRSAESQRGQQNESEMAAKHVANSGAG